MNRRTRNPRRNAAWKAAFGMACLAALNLGGCGSGKEAGVRQGRPDRHRHGRSSPETCRSSPSTSRRPRAPARSTSTRASADSSTGGSTPKGRWSRRGRSSSRSTRNRSRCSSTRPRRRSPSRRRPSKWRAPTSRAPGRSPRQNALSQKDLDDATGQFQSAAAAVDQAKAQLESAKLNLSYCTITSPVDGVTGAALQQEGTYISPQNSQLTTVMVLSPMWVNFSLSENEMQNVRDQIAKGLFRPPKNQTVTRSRSSWSTGRSSRTPGGSPSPTRRTTRRRERSSSGSASRIPTASCGRTSTCASA